jgi:hypothetical protein
MSEGAGIPIAIDESHSHAHERASATPVASSEERRPGERVAAGVTPVRLALPELQAWFTRAMLHPEGSDDGHLLPVPAALVLPSAALSPDERVDIYRRAYRARLIECLADDYGAVQHALGEDSFDAACREYIDRYPSRSPSLNFYGRAFAAFLRNYAHPASQFASDLAALEWALVEVVHAGAVARLTPEALANVPSSCWAEARLVPSATVRVLELGHPANAYFQAFRTGESPAIPGPCWSAVAVYRDGSTLWRMELSRPMHFLLRALDEGRSLGEAIDTAVSEHAVTEREAGDVLRWFRDWVGHGFFSQILVER